MGAGLVDLGDPRVPEAGQDLGFVLEAAQRRLGGDALTHDLHGNDAVGLLLDGLVNRAHAAGGDEPPQVVAADALAGEAGVGRRAGRLVAQVEVLAEGGGVEEGPRGGVLVEHGVDLLPQRGVAGALPVEQRGPLLQLQVAGGREELVQTVVTLRVRGVHRGSSSSEGQRGFRPGQV